MDFSDSIRAEFELGTGHVEHRRIDELLRSERIGFVDGTMWSGPSKGADYTEIRVNFKSTDPGDLIRKLLDQKLIAGDTTWFVNGVEFKTSQQDEETDAG